MVAMEATRSISMNDVVPAPVSSSTEAFKEAAALHDAGDFVGAEALLYEALKANSRRSALWNARGVMFGAMERYVDAVRCYREALARCPSGHGIWTNLGNALTQLKQLKSAIACHQRAIALSPKPPRRPLDYPDCRLRCLS